MTPTQYLTHLLGLQSDQQVGFLLTVLLAFILGWLAKEWRDKLRTARWKRALWKGERMVKR